MKDQLLTVLLILFILTFLLYLLALKRNAILREKLDKLAFERQSQASRYGKITEQFMPFLDSYPYDSSNFRFLGTPIDGIQFEKDKIIFMEFKTASGTLTEKQKQIKELVEQHKVYFEERSLR
jgi:predicted Holliday junction resolvase-like endonuclease